MTAVLFDMDGVLVDSERYWPAYLREHVFDAAVADGADPETYFGLGVTDTYRALEAAGEVRVDRATFVELNDEAAARIYREEVALLDGFDELAGELRRTGVRLGLVSSSYRRWIDMVLERFGIGDRFDVVVSGEDIDGPGKPEPHVYLRASDRLSVAPEACLVVEDSPNGVAAARAAGMTALGYLEHADGDTLDGADACVADPAELRERVTEWVRSGTLTTTERGE